MDIQEAKIRVRVGELELEFIGSEELLQEKLEPFLDAFIGFREKLGNTSSELSQVSDTEVARQTGELPWAELSPSTIAVRLSAKTGPQLAEAAAAYRTICCGELTFTRKQIIDTMREMPTLHNKNMNSNLSKNLMGLVKNATLNETQNGLYTLTEEAKERILKNLE